MRNPQSIWSDLLRGRTRQAGSFPALTRDERVDAVVVGAGITGLTLGVLLCAKGLRVALVERARIASGTTGATSAHVTAVPDLPLETLVSRFGSDAAQGVVESSLAAVDEIERRARALAGNCGFARIPAFRFSEDPSGVEELERERDVAKQLGFEAVLQRAPILPARCAGALRFERQARIQPLEYAEALAAAFVAWGGRLFEQTPVVSVDDRGVAARTGQRVEARYVVHATHTPIGSVPSIQARLIACTSYVLAATLAARVTDGLYWDDASPYHYLRTAGNGSLLVAGGEDHRTGRERDAVQRHRALERWVRERFAVRRVEARWSHELFEPADGLPYVGFLPGSSSQLVATGFSGTGLAFGTLAAMLLAELVTGGASPWAALYSPERLGPLSAMPHTAAEGLRVGWRFLADRVRGQLGSALADLPPDSGRRTRIEGRLVAAYRDVRGDLHALSPRCTHLGCLVAWNDAEKTWDCPCHGGRFHATGKVLYGPPVSDLERLLVAEDPAEAEPDEP